MRTNILSSDQTEIVDYIVNNKPKQQNVPESSYFGTSTTGTNKVSDFYQLQTHDPIRYNNTTDDQRQILNQYILHVQTNPVLSFYPWLYPLPIIDLWSNRTEEILNENITIKQPFEALEIMFIGFSKSIITDSN